MAVNQVEADGAATTQGVGGDIVPAERFDELAAIISAYNEVTEKLQRSHESLRAQTDQLQRDLASTDAQLQRSRRLAALGEMAAGIAHEIRNPLAALHLYASMLVQDLADIGEQLSDHPRQVDAFRSATENAAKIAEATRGLNAIVTDVLSFSRELKPKIKPILVSQLFKRAVEANRPAIDAAGIVVQRPESSDMALCGDADLLHQALVNIIRNAVEAMRDSHDSVNLSLDARQENDRIVLIVRDSGPGIPDEAIDRIFNPFFTTRNTGTGLGLAIVHRIVDAHSGTIAVHNDGGAVFELSLPRRAGDEANHGANA